MCIRALISGAPPDPECTTDGQLHVIGSMDSLSLIHMNFVLNGDNSWTQRELNARCALRIHMLIIFYCTGWSATEFVY